VEYFDRSFAGTARLSVSLAFSKKKGPSSSEGGQYRPWSKHSVGSSRYEKLRQEKEERGKKDQHPEGVGKHGKKLQKEDDDDDETNGAESEEVKRKREEFLSAMGISAASKKGGDNGKVSKSKFWANDDVAADAGAGAEQSNSNPAGLDESGSSNKNDSGSDSDSDSDSATTNSNDSERENDGNKPAVTEKKVTSDLAFLRSKQVKADILSDDDESVDEKGEDDGDDSSSSSSSSSSGSGSDDMSEADSDSSNEDEEDSSKSTGEQNLIQPSKNSTESSNNKFDAGKENTNKSYPVNSSNTALINRLFVRNLPFTTTEEDLSETFAQFGEVSSVHIPVDDSKRNKGYAFITFVRKQDAKLAMDSMDGEDFQGRLIHILPARPSVDNKDDDADMNDLTYKERQELERQRDADKTSKGWSASLIRGDAVVDNLSDRLGVSKGEVLNVKDGISSGNAAVRLALGETHIISENIAFFEEHGVDVTALDSSKSKNNKTGKLPSPLKRSKTMILVKNLPYDTNLEELTKVFHSIGGGVPQKILLPPSKTAALVEYDHVSDARRAFRRLAYKKFKHVPLYLEWAPMKAEGDQESPNKGDLATKDVSMQKGSEIVVKKGMVGTEDPVAEIADTTGVSHTIYIKNLNFSTSEQQLNKAFAKAGFHPRAVKIPAKMAPIKSKRNGTSATESSSNPEMRQLSMGFGFVEFSSEEEVLKAMKGMQGQLVDGHALEIKLSTKSVSSSLSKAAPTSTNASSKNTKIMVRNVPFEATRTELLQLFGSFGQLKKVRLPKKFDGTHRGFAFCEFLTSKEAQNAMATLSRTHLYGRHLVLEWASVDDGKNDLHVNTARQKAKRDATRAGLGDRRAGGQSAKKGKHLKF